MTTAAERVAAWIAVYEANSPYAAGDRTGASYESAPLLLSDLKTLLTDLEYFRGVPNLADYTKALEDRAVLAAVKAVIESHSPLGEDVPADALRTALER